MASISGLFLFPWAPIDGTIEHGVVVLSRLLGSDENYKLSNVRVMALCPGRTNTPLIEKIFRENQNIYPSYKTFLEQLTTYPDQE